MLVRRKLKETPDISLERKSYNENVFYLNNLFLKFFFL
jgi:hypothetical protein